MPPAVRSTRVSLVPRNFVDVVRWSTAAGMERRAEGKVVSYGMGFEDLSGPKDRSPGPEATAARTHERPPLLRISLGWERAEWPEARSAGRSTGEAGLTRGRVRSTLPLERPAESVRRPALVGSRRQTARRRSAERRPRETFSADQRRHGKCRSRPSEHKKALCDPLGRGSHSVILCLSLPEASEAARGRLPRLPYQWPALASAGHFSGSMPETGSADAVAGTRA